MRTSSTARLAVLAGFIVLFGAAAAHAGGPLVLFDEATRTPYAYPPGDVDYFTDLGPNGILTNDESDSLTARAFREWNNVPTSYFSAALAGEILVDGVPTDITLANIDSIYAKFNGGGIHVIYDSDGSIISGFFGAPPGVAGIAGPEFADDNSPVLLESFAIFNGATINPADSAAASFSGVYTHEIGHAINLAHTQTNGAILFFGDDHGAGGCADLGGTPTFAHIETMYPFIDPSPGSTGIDQFSVDQLDDIAALSDLYPAAGWPASFGTITGTVFMPDSVTEVTGINVIARNAADPLGDANSALSGDYTQGALGPDGLFTLNGLTPGAEYILYIDEIVDGGYSTVPTNVAFFEEYWNGPGESGNVDTDTACVYVTIPVAAGSQAVADIYLNIDPSALALGDEDAVRVDLPFDFPFCGATYDHAWVGSNGYVTFGVGDANGFSTPTGLLVGPPRICGFWADLTPNLGGSISARQVGNDFQIKYSQVPEQLFGGSNNFTITLRPDGSHQVVYGQLDALFQALAGRSQGAGAPDPGPTDLSTAPQPLGQPPGNETVYETYILGSDLAGLTLEYASCGQVTAVPEPGVLPAAFALRQSAPNPFRAATVIAFDLPRSGPVELRVFDARGRLVRTLVEDSLAAGRYSVNWTGTDDSGRRAAPGLYFYRLVTPGNTAGAKTVLLR